MSTETKMETRECYGCGKRRPTRVWWIRTKATKGEWEDHDYCEACASRLPNDATRELEF